MLSLMSPQQFSFEEQLNSAESYDQWLSICENMDRQNGMEEWRHTEISNSYDYASIRKRLDKLRLMRANNDYQHLLFTLNEGIHSNLGGIGKPSLYNKAKAGTKVLVEDYIAEICTALKLLNNADESLISYAEKQDFFSRASACNGRSALMLSGGGIMGIFHAGVLRALHEQDLLPSVISGSSMGSLMAAMVCTHPDDKIQGILSIDAFCIDYIKLSPKQENKKTLLSLFMNTSNVTGEDLDKILTHVIPDLTFQEALECYGKQLNITISGEKRSQAPRLLNAISSPNVTIRSAIKASCAVSGFFPSVMLEAKNAEGEKVPYLSEQRWIDGSFLHDFPTKRLARIYGINHFIGSMTNPLVLSLSTDPDASDSLAKTVLETAGSITKFATSQFLDLSHKIFRTRSKELSRFRYLAQSLVKQSYSADINIRPSNGLHNPLNLLSPPSRDEIAQFIKDGELSTWKRIEMIRNCTKISRTIDSIISEHGWAVEVTN